MHDNIDTGAGTSPSQSEWETLDGLRRQLEAKLFDLNKAVLLDALASPAIELHGVNHSLSGYGKSNRTSSLRKDRERIEQCDKAVPLGRWAGFVLNTSKKFS